MLAIPKDSKLYRREDYYISSHEDAHSSGLPAVQTQRKLQKERSTQLNMILKGLIRERLIGCLKNEDMLEDEPTTYRVRESPLKHIAKTTLIPMQKRINRCQNHERQRSIGSTQDKQDYHASFISAVEVPHQVSKTAKKQRPASLNLPPIRIATIGINRSLWKHISVGNKLKKELFVRYLAGRFGDHICNNIIRFFEPVFEGVFFRYSDFVDSIAKSNISIQRFVMFQIYDYDADGIVSCQDLFKILQMLGDIPQKEIIQSEIYRLRTLIEKTGAKQGQVKGQSLLEYLSLNHNLTLAEMNQVLDEQHRPFLESNIKKFTGYQHTFLVTEHNQDIRMLKHRAEDIKINMEKEFYRKRAGIPFDTFAEHSQPILQRIIQALCGADFNP